jgi:tetratricopeptide (TPR) repeat protein
MFKAFLEWYKSKSEPRFKSYREARLIYEAFVYEKRIQFDSLSRNQCKEALQDDRLRKAERLYREAINISKMVDADEDVATALSQLGMLLHLKGRFDEAIQAFENSIKIIYEMSQTNRSGQATASGCYYHLGIIACRNGLIEKGKMYINRSLEIDEANNDIHGKFLSNLALEKCSELSASSFDDKEWKETIDAEQSRRDDIFQSPVDISLPEYTSEVSETSQESSIAEHGESAQGLYGESQFKQGFWRDVVWLLSHSITANDRFMTPMEQLVGKIRRKLIISRAAFGSSSPEKTVLKPLEPNEKLCAAVVIIEKVALKDETFRYWLNWCIEYVAAKEDFRLFVCLHDMSIDEFEKLSREGDSILASLKDTVQVLELPSPDHLAISLKGYLDKLDSIRSEAFWRKIRIRSAIILGSMSSKVQFFCGAFLGIAALSAFVFKKGSVPNRFADTNELFIAVVAGSVLFPLLVTPLFLLFQGRGAMSSLIGKNPRIRHWLILFAFLGPATIGLPQHVGAPVSYIMLGVVVGILLDITRRNGLQAKRDNISLEKALKVSKISSLPDEIIKLVREGDIDPIRRPLFPAIALKVFISYTRSSDWSKHYAAEIHKTLLKIGVCSFLDRENIGEGSSWRNQLNRSISDANVFITVIDQKSVNREWVASEIITALEGKRLAKIPEVIALIEPKLPEAKIDSMLPIFKTILHEYDKPAQEGKPRIIAIQDRTIQTVISSLKPKYYHTSSVFPPQFSSLLAFLTIPLVAIGSVASVLGLPAAGFAYLEYWNKIDSSSILSSWGMLVTAYLLCGYWLGFVGRLTIASRFEVQHNNPSMLTMVNAISFIGLAGILAVWSPHVTVLIIGWALALCYIGWMLGKLFIARIVQDNPKLIK